MSKREQDHLPQGLHVISMRRGRRLIAADGIHTSSLIVARTRQGLEVTEVNQGGGIIGRLKFTPRVIEEEDAVAIYIHTRPNLRRE